MLSNRHWFRDMGKDKALCMRFNSGSAKVSLSRGAETVSLQSQNHSGNTKVN